jgi:23S rRNA (guanosine2251-2'-O)-methyltransferase
MITIKGKHAIEEALSTGAPVRHIFIATGSENNKDMRHIQLIARQKQVMTSILSKQEFKQRFSDSHSQNIIAEMGPVAHIPFESILEDREKFSKLVILDHLEDPHNFGAIARTCVALGIDAIIYPKDRQVGITSGVMKASSGAIYHIPIARVANIGNAIEQLKRHDVWIYGTDVNSGEDLSTATINTPFALIVGNEETGISQRISKMVDMNVHIPMSGNLDSLNVSVATGIILYTFLNQ